MTRTVTRAVRSYLPPALVVVAVLAGWQLLATAGGVPEYLLPSPARVLATGWGERDALARAARTTLLEIGLGYAIAVVAGLLVALLLHSSTTLRRALYPLLIGSQTIPVVVLAPILAIAFGYGIVPKLVIVVLICFFPIVVNALDGLRGVDPELVRLMRTLDAGRWARFWRVEFPSALPSIFSGARIAATFAAIGAVFGEWAGSTEGLGYLMLQATPQLRTALVFAAILLLTAVSVVLFLLVSLLERLIAPWAGEK